MNDPLSAWSVGDGVWWIQTREPRLARKLAKRSDTRLVAVGVAGGFLRIFEMRRSPAFVRNLVARYVAANERFGEAEGTQDSAKRPGRVTARVPTNKCHSSRRLRSGDAEAQFRFSILNRHAHIGLSDGSTRDELRPHRALQQGGLRMDARRVFDHLRAHAERQSAHGLHAGLSG